ncbi:MAG: amidohydrolase family protein [Eubacteriales bacterium]
MIIDFHTHAFPDALAAKTIPYLAEKAAAVPCTDGTAGALVRRLRDSGVSLGVVLPVVTRPAQFRSVNAFAAELCRTPGLLSFGGIHPDDGDIEGHLAEIQAMGLRGIKIHPDYQGVYIDDARYVRIARQALRLGLIVVTHAGVDDGFPDTVRCSPERAARFLDAVEADGGPETARIVFAHGGGNRQFPDVVRYLAGRNVYFDLSFIFNYAKPEEVMDIIRAHGVSRILFASDCPWGDPAEGVRFVRSLPLSEAEREAILAGNARALLGGKNLL